MDIFAFLKDNVAWDSHMMQLSALWRETETRGLYLTSVGSGDWGHVAEDSRRNFNMDR